MRTTILCAAASGLCFFIAFDSQAQNNGAALSHFHKAVVLIDESMAAYGGAAKTDSLASLYIEYKTTKYMDGQSSRFGAPNLPLPATSTVAIDFKGNRLVNETADRYRGGYLFHFRSVYGPQAAFNYEVGKLRFSGITDLPVANNEAVRQTLLRHLPNFVVRAAASKKSTLRYGGRRKMDGRQTDWVSFAYSPTLTLDLYIDMETKLLYAYRFFTDHLLHGAQEVRYVFPAYRLVSGIPFPTHKWVHSNGALMRVDSLKNVEANAAVNEALFQRPDGYGPAVVLPTTVKEIGRNIFMIEGLNGYNPMFLNFKDHIVLIEPVNGMEKAVQLIGQRFPGKRISKVLLSHYHEDHTAGLPYIIQQRIPIVTTPSNKAYVEHVNNAVHFIYPQGPMPNTAVVETINTRQRWSDENLTVELIPVGPNSHADELLAFYFPDEKILYQADMLISKDKGGLVLPLIPVNVELHKFIKREKLPVKTIYGVHWKEVEFAILDEAVKAFELKTASPVPIETGGEGNENCVSDG
jgi:glyoxylase-like metal-dependent hydrolase (beta-lactamase superfamily II)